ncbi:alanine dehydrogenase [Ligilactobacillus pobuzihii]|uniref:Alanine dehydrogenase n=1 Tax=Ligilactobacillus pobuzihii TaxID=449659 RepID=A0A0R2LI15_9LACO|nr:alanine dehydrogenase [Ligilactobacillus pobuzihii]KRK08924.1 L-alanine dehydrogenase [Ligilactobacillus pobuzihii E100301 = KCTC 13174]KRN99686.1 L-alanine dehydrogenase [Ligilactobacillus pobuzihii]GEN49322.1 alanine dehydrogenase [Ligilactobacillus pobuzihii]
MKVGIPRELKNNENRVALPPSGVFELIEAGHEVFVETNAGLGSAFEDQDYRNVGATVVNTPDEIWSQEMVMKVKEPLPEEFKYFHEGLLLFTYLHLANALDVAVALQKAGVTSVAYENVKLDNGTLPLLSPMSEIAGRMATQIGAEFLESPKGGKGIILSGVPGVRKGHVVIIGGGVAGTNAARVALGLGSRVTVLDVNNNRLKELDTEFNGRIETLMSNSFNIATQLQTADLVVGAVLIPGHKAPTLVTKEMVADMPDKSVVVDIAIDQGGIFETENKVGTHDDPTYVVNGVTHYAVANMPGAVSQTATIALSNATLPFAKRLASGPIEDVWAKEPSLLRGANTYQGHLVQESVAEDLGLPYTPLTDLLPKNK